MRANEPITTHFKFSEIQPRVPTADPAYFAETYAYKTLDESPLFRYFLDINQGQRSIGRAVGYVLKTTERHLEGQEIADYLSRDSIVLWTFTYTAQLLAYLGEVTPVADVDNSLPHAPGIQFIDNIYLAPDFRREGLARVMIEELPKRIENDILVSITQIQTLIHDDLDEYLVDQFGADGPVPLSDKRAFFEACGFTTFKGLDETAPEHYVGKRPYTYVR